MAMDIEKHRRVAHGIGGLQENLRQIVFGGNDGIVTTFAVVAGFAGAQAEGTVQMGIVAVLIFGFANLFADATSMGLGEFLSSRSEKDVYNATRHREMELIRTEPEAEFEEVVAMLQQRNLAEGEARDLAGQLARHPELMADFMMSYDFGMANPDDSNPVVKGLYTFFSFLVFGLVPILPYALGMPVNTAFQASVAATAFALLMLGTFRGFVTREGMRRSILETLLVGGTCAVVAYGVGWLIGG